MAQFRAASFGRQFLVTGDKRFVRQVRSDGAVKISRTRRRRKQLAEAARNQKLVAVILKQDYQKIKYLLRTAPRDANPSLLKQLREYGEVWEECLKEVHEACGSGIELDSVAVSKRGNARERWVSSFNDCDENK